jgi:hypothetical protein
VNGANSLMFVRKTIRHMRLQQQQLPQQPQQNQFTIVRCFGHVQKTFSTSINNNKNLFHDSFNEHVNLPLLSPSSKDMDNNNYIRLQRLLTQNINNKRRRLLTSSCIGITTSLILTDDGYYIHPVSAATGTSTTGNTTDAGEIIRRSASNIPGYGPSDVFYPLDWQGTWNVRREVTIPKQQKPVPDTSLSMDNPASTDVPIVLNYPIRFIQSIQDDAVVADRGFNQASLERSIRLISGSYTTTSTGSRSEDVSGMLDPIRSYKWSESNPNDIFLEFFNGSRKYIKITKRSYDYDSTTNIVSSSEYQRVTQDDLSTSTTSMPGSIPTITARRIVSKYKPILSTDTTTSTTTTVNAIEAIEIVYDVSTSSSSNDPMSFQLQQQSQQSQQPKILSKSKLYLTRTQRII